MKIDFRQMDEHIEHSELLKRVTVLKNFTAPVQQRFEALSKAPPLPIIDITNGYIDLLANIPFMSYVNRVIGNFSSQPLQISQTKKPTPTTIITSTARRSSAATSQNATLDTSIPAALSLLRRQNDIGHCGPGNPCSDGSCCNADRNCGYGPDNCGSGCISNCAL
jgi:hypothetical protein